MNLKPYTTRVTRLSVLPDGEPIFSEQCAHISIEDEAAGEFVQVQQRSGRSDAETQTIAIDPDEWPHLRDAIDRMIKECKQ
jgi:hypothetical protein